MSSRTNATPQLNRKAHDFPKPSSPSLRKLFDHIEIHLWPKWSFHERHEFVQKRREQLVLSDSTATLAELLEKPFTCNIFEKPYSAVSVSIGISIWGVETVQSRPAMWEFATGQANRMASLFDNHPNSYGKSFKELENQSQLPRSRPTRHSTATSHHLIEIKSENERKRHHDGLGGKVYKLPRRAVLVKPPAAVSRNGRVGGIAATRPSRRSRRTVNYDESDSCNDGGDEEYHPCSPECNELKAKLQAANAQLKKVTAEKEAQNKDAQTSLQQAKASAKEQLARAVADKEALLAALDTQAQVASERLAKVSEERDSLRDALSNHTRASEEHLAQIVSDKDALQAALDNQRRVTKEQLSKIAAEKDALREAMDKQSRAANERLSIVVADKDSLQGAYDNQRRAAKEQLSKVFAEKDNLQAALDNQRRVSKDQLAKFVAEKESLQAALDSQVHVRVGQEDMDKFISEKAALQESWEELREKYNSSLVLSFPGVAALKLILTDHAKTQVGHESNKIAQSLLGVVNDAYVRMLVTYSVETSQTTGPRRN